MGSPRFRAVPVGEGKASAWVSANADGVVTFGDLGPGAHRIAGRRGPLAAETTLGEVPADDGAAAGASGAAAALRLAWVDPPASAPASPGVVRVLAPDGTPLSSFQIRIGIAGGFGGYGEGKDGAFTRMPHGETWDTEYVVMAKVGGPQGFAPTAWKAEPLEPGAEPPVIRTAAGRVVRGRVVDASGAGVVGAELHARPRDAQKEWTFPEVHARATTEADGSFRFDSLGAFRYEVEAKLPAALIAKAGPWRFDETATDVRFEADRGIEVTIRVVDFDGKPVAGAMASASVPTAGANLGFSGFTFPASKATTDASGSIRVGPLDGTGRFVLVVSPPLDRKDLLALTVKDWTPADGEHRLERGYTVRGILRDADGKPVSATVERKEENGSFRPVVGSGRDGTFTIAQLRAGRLVLRAAPYRVPGTAGTPGPEVTVDAGDENVELRLAP